jgi:hypothetical protein
VLIKGVFSFLEIKYAMHFFVVAGTMHRVLTESDRNIISVLSGPFYTMNMYK